MAEMKVSIVTAVYNCEQTVGMALRSVAEQSHSSIEHVVIDGMSTDETPSVIAEFKDSVSVSVREPDDGIYNALNKGIRLCTGDIIGLLHADDVLASSRGLERIADAFADPDVDAVFGDLAYVDAVHGGRVIRYWQEKPFRVSRFRRGWMPPHPTVYMRKSVYEQLGGFREDFEISADYELMVRAFVKHQLRAQYVPQRLVEMRVGGKSNASLSNRRTANREDRLAWEVNGMKPPALLRLTKPLRKLPQYWRRPGPQTA
ncbi:MAG: glycosyltransferase family 2 protein [Planctomycetota bacterium]